MCVFNIHTHPSECLPSWVWTSTCTHLVPLSPAALSGDKRETLVPQVSTYGNSPLSPARLPRIPLPCQSRPPVYISVNTRLCKTPVGVWEWEGREGAALVCFRGLQIVLKQRSKAVGIFLPSRLIEVFLYLFFSWHFEHFFGLIVQNPLSSTKHEHFNYKQYYKLCFPLVSSGFSCTQKIWS